jgi:heme-degrading monooxygenase HmoA
MTLSTQSIITHRYRLHSVTSFPIRRAESDALAVPRSRGARYLSFSANAARCGHFDIEIDYVAAFWERDTIMFSVIFEVLPNSEKWNDYLDKAEMLRPEVEQVDGFVDNIRYKSLTREGWILSLSIWRDEKSLVRWRTRGRHHEVQQIARDEILAEYHLRVGQITADNQVPTGYALTEQRLDETEVGEGTTVTLINATRPAEWKQTNNPYDCAEWLGLNPWAADSTSWDIFDAMITAGDLMLLISWKDAAAARAYEDASLPNDNARVRTVRIVRDYGKYDRREAPQYYADAKGGDTLHADSASLKRACCEFDPASSKHEWSRRPLLMKPET